jgi:diaminopropionate ammonia-lyase
LPGYSPTPLVKLPSLAGKLGISNLLIKDESRRFDLNAFKVLGASYAMARLLKDMVQSDPGEITYDAILSKAENFNTTTFVTATDGNHGRAVAWAAEKFGCKAVVYMPKGSSGARLSAIQDTGAEVSIIDGNYDEAVKYAEKMAREKDWILLQDTAWKGYEKIPAHIMQGYFTLLSEFISQEKDIWPTHVFVQAGVGSFAASMLAFMCRCVQKPKPAFVVVEPSGAPCYYKSMEIGDGKPHRIHGDLQTIMAGLACGQPSLIGWEILKTGADAFIVCSDEVARQGVRILADPTGNDTRIVSGESGAVTPGLVHELLSRDKYFDIRKKLFLDNDSNILLISTEGVTDSD